MGLINWDKYHPVIKLETDNFVMTDFPNTLEGMDTLMQMERMRELGYRFVVEGWQGLIWEKTAND